MVNLNTSMSQVVQEREIYSANADFAMIYNFLYDEGTGSYCYIETDPVTFKYRIKSRYGESKGYDYLSNYYIKFDAMGNYYCIASNYYPEGTFDSSLYYLIINGEEIAQFEYAEAFDAYVNPNQEYEFTIREGEKFKIAKVSSTKQLSYSQEFDEIRVAWRYIPAEEYSGDFEPYVRDANGYRYYITRNNQRAYFVHGNNIVQTPYSDIDNTSIVFDNNGAMTFIAKTNGRFWEDDGNEIVVQGDKTYRTFLKVFSPVLFTSANEPVYIVSDMKIDGDIYVSNLAVGNDIRPAFTDASRTKKVEDFTAGIYDLKILNSGEIAYIGSVRTNWDEWDFETVYSKSTFVVNDIASPFYFEPGMKATNIFGDELFTSNPTSVYGTSVLNLISRGESRVVSDPKFNFIVDYGFTPNGDVFYVGMVQGNYDLGIKDKYTIVVNSREFGTYPALIYSEVEDGRFSYLSFDKQNNFAYATYELIDSSENYEDWYSISFLKTNSGTVTPTIINYPGRAFFNSIERFMYLDDGKLFYIGNSFDDSNPYLIYSQLNVGLNPLDKVYNAITDFKYDRLMNRMTFRASRDNKIYDVVVQP